MDMFLTSMGYFLVKIDEFSGTCECMKNRLILVDGLKLVALSNDRFRLKTDLKILSPSHCDLTHNQETFVEA
ncbi:MAG: hypothetical protein ACK5QX_02805, partial [bacterium]